MMIAHLVLIPMVCSGVLRVPECIEAQRVLKPYPGDTNGDGVRDDKDLWVARQANDHAAWLRARNHQGAEPEVLIDGIAYHILIGDMNYDGKLDGDDVFSVALMTDAQYFNEYMSDPKNKRWAEKHQDQNGDGVFNQADVTLISGIVFDTVLPISKPYGKWHPKTNMISPLRMIPESVSGIWLFVLLLTRKRYGKYIRS